MGRGPFRRALILAAAAAALVGARPSEAEIDVNVGLRVVSKDAVKADFSSILDTDAYLVDLSEGGSLSIAFKYPKKSTLAPSIRLFAPDGHEEIPGKPLRFPGTTKTSLAKYVVPAGMTGTWRVLLGVAGSPPGEYTATFTVANAKATSVKGLVVPAGGTARVAATADSGAALTISVSGNPKLGPGLASARLLDPHGVEVPGAAAKLLLAKPTKLTGKAIGVNQGFGRYVLELTGLPAGPTTMTASMSVKFAKAPPARKIALGPEVTLTPFVVDVRQATAIDIPIVGTNLAAGGTVAVSGAGVTIDSVTVHDATSALAHAVVAADAAFGLRDLAWIPAPLVGEPVVLPGAVNVKAPRPTITSVSIPSIKQGEGPVTLTVTGTGFRAGGSLLVSGAGLAIGSTTVDSDTQVSATVTAAGDAEIGAHFFAWMQPATGGGDSGTLTAPFLVLYPDPTIATVAPSSARQLDSGVLLTLTGTNFRPDGTVTCGSGVSVSNLNFVSATKFEATLAIDGAATLGPRDVVYAQATAGGGATATKTGAFAVKAPIPTVTSIDVTSATQGATGVVVTLTGTNFRSGGTVSFGTGVSTTATSLLSSTSYQATIDVGLTSAPLGLHDVVYSQPAAGGGDSATLPSALQINAPTPTVASISPTSVAQGSTGTVITLTGTNFRTGGSVSFGTGISVTATGFVSPTSFTATVDAGLTTATLGLHDVVFTQSPGGGSASGTLPAGLQVNAPTPTVSSISPTSVVQGATGVVITLTGTNFRSGGQPSFGTGVSVTATNFVSTTSFQATVDVGLTSAPLGPHDAVFIQPAVGGGASGTLTNALQVDAPPPTISSVSPLTLNQDGTNVVFTLNGTILRAGGTISFSGSGVTAGATTFVTTSQITAPVSIATNAAVGARDVTYTHPAAGGGASVFSVGAVTIRYPDPTIATVVTTPSSVVQGASSVQIDVTGTGFRSDGGASVSGTGISTVTGYTFNSATSFSMTVSVAGNATLGSRDLTYTQNVVGGGASVTKTGAFSVLSPAPTLTSLTPSQWLPGATLLTAGVVGTNFNSGTAVTVSGSNVTIHSTTFVSATQLTFVFSVASNAAVGQRDLTITPGAGGGPAATFTNALTIIPADPTVTSFSAATVAQGTSNFAVTIRGTNFRSGDGVAAGGSGVTFSSVSVVDAATITANVSATAGAATGARDVTVSHAASEGGRSATKTGAFTVVSSASPTVTAVTPAILGRTASGGATRSYAVAVTGTNFASDATLSASKTSGSGVSVVGGSSAVVNATTLTATISVAGGATSGTWNLIVTNPNTAAGTGTNLLDIKDENTLAVNAVSPSSGSTSGGERVAVLGSGFAAGAVVDFGTVRAGGVKVIDKNTITCVVPAPAALSTSAATLVGVKVTSGGNATLANGYAYAADTGGGPRITATIPANGASGAAQNTRVTLFVLGERALSSTVASTTGFDWFGLPSNDIASARVASVALAPGGRVVAVRRNASPTNLASSNQYYVSIPVTVTDLAGAALVPTLVSSTSSDQTNYAITATSDSTGPTLTSITPTSGSSGVATMTSVTLVFGEPLDPATLNFTNITFKTGGSPVAATMSLGADAQTVTIVPDTELTAGATYTTNVTAGVLDLCGNAFSNTSYTFTTAAADATGPTIDSVTIESIPSDLDGSGTWIDKNGSSQPFDLYLPRSGWLVTLTWSDGGVGVDETTFSAKANVAVGISPATTELAGNFTKSAVSASWRIPASGFSAGDGATFTFNVSDKNANAATAKVITFNVADIAATATGDGFSNGTFGGDHDPFNSKQTWVLRSDLDAYTATYSTPGGTLQGVTTTVAADNVPDFEQALRLVGLNSGGMTANSAACVNGLSRGTNSIVARLVMERLRALLRAHFGIAEDGTTSSDSVNIEFLLPGEQGSLASMPTYAAANSSNSGAAFSEMSIGGTLGAEAGATTTTSTLAQAWSDGRNNRQEKNLNFGVGGSTTGVYLIGMMKLQVNGSSGSAFRTRVSNRLVTVYGGTPAGEGALDDVVLAGSFVRSSGSAAQQQRYDDLMDAVELVAAYAASTTAHEIGHSTGLVMNKIVSGTPGDGAPKTGLFGNARYGNSFTEATSGSPNTSFHMNYLGNDTMAPATSFDNAVATGSNFQFFSPLDIAYLRRRLLYDEGQ